ncbi:MAG: hypoxanthine phosphoribosyltransferase [Desulfurispora sp.]|uniref:hypoxanthine phosphoribosyltransferase n=1 Tax=Desulfurispora sp. TaxID=3014275 RepID=UPI004049287A
MHPDAREILITEQQITSRVAELGRQISRDYAGREILVVGILKGAVLFLADLVRHIDVPLCLDFMAVSSYGATTASSGVVQIIKDLEQSIEGRHVLIVEDIVDTGLTLKYLRDNLATRRPASLRICTLLDKPGRRKVPVQVDYNGFVIPDEFVVGYGLDYAERYRNLREILVLKPEVYRS